MSSFKIKDFVDFFEMEIVSGANNLDGTINVYGLNRAGLELAGYFAQNKDPKTKRAILMSSKESDFIQQFDKETRVKKYKDLLNSGSPLIIVTQKFTDDLLFEVANKQNFPIVRVNAPSTNEISQQILDYYDEIFAPSEEAHASLLNIFGKGVLIQGESGIGKSEVSIELIKNNHLFVGDDRIILTHKGGKVYGKSHPVLEHLVEVRGIGIIDLSKTLGYQVMMYETPIDIVIELTKFREGGIDTTDRLGNDWATQKILGTKIPHLKIPVSAGRNIANIIEAAVGQLKLQLSGEAQDIIELMSERSKK